MRLKSFFTLVGALIAASLLVAVIGVCNEEKFSSEYWLQRKVDDVAVLRKTFNASSPDSVIRYRFYDSTGIDFTLEIGSHDTLRIARHTWFQSSKAQEVFSAKLKPDTFRYLARKFGRTWHGSQRYEVKDHFGGTYAEIELMGTKNSSGEKLVGFYNVRPDPAFEDFRREMLKLAQEKL